MRIGGYLRALIISALISTSAFGQGTVLQSGPWAPNHVPVYTQGGQSQPFIFDSGPAAGGALGTGASEFNITQQGTPSSIYGTPFCINDAPINATAGFHQFCLGANSVGGGLIAYDAYAGAAPLPLDLIINGVEYTFPFNVGGGIEGPSTTVVNDIVTWNNTTGTLVKDSGVPISEVALLTGATFTGPVSIVSNPETATSPTANPTGGALLPTFSSFVVQADTIKPSNREFLVNLGLVSSTGAGVANSNGDKVVLYTGVVADAGSGNVWSMNPVLQQSAASGTYNAQVIEVDLNNFNADRGGSDGPSGQPATVANGISISGTNDSNGFQNTAGLAIDSFGATSGTGLFAHGVTINGSFEFNEFADYGVSPTAFALFGGHTYGWDCNQATLSGGCIRLATGRHGGIVGRNAANSADAGVIRYDGTNIFECETSCGGTFFNSPLTPMANLTFALGSPIAQWASLYVGVITASNQIFVNGTQVATASGIAGECAQFINSQLIEATGSPCGSGGGGGGGAVGDGITILNNTGPPATLTAVSGPSVSTSLTVSSGTTTISPTTNCALSVCGEINLLLAANTTFTVSPAATDGQLLKLRLQQDPTGTREVAFDSSVDFGTTIPSFTASTAPNAVDFAGLQWDAAKSRWMFLAFALGF